MAEAHFKVVDPRLAAGRGEEFSAGTLRDAREAGEELRLPINQRIEDSLDTDGLQMASRHEAIPESNRGFQMLQRMGWKGQGLGTKEDGIQEPVGPGNEAGVRLGLGKQEEDEFYTASDNIQRKRLEVEIQADEDASRTAMREALQLLLQMQAEREQRIREDVSTIKRTFYCEVCHKQYSSAAELEVHLSSYDHHHRKRLVEMRMAEYERTRKSRTKREKKRQEKEMARLDAQIQKAQAPPPVPADSAQPALPDEAPPPPPPELQPPLPPDAQPPLPPGVGRPMMDTQDQPQRGAVQFNMGRPGAAAQKPAVLPGRGLSVKGGAVQKKPQRLKSSVAVFALDSDEEP